MQVPPPEAPTCDGVADGGFRFCPLPGPYNCGHGGRWIQECAAASEGGWKECRCELWDQYTPCEPVGAVNICGPVDRPDIPKGTQICTEGGWSQCDVP